MLLSVQIIMAEHFGARDHFMLTIFWPGSVRLSVREAVRCAQFSYALSPVQIIVAEQRRAWYHFVTTTCAVVGGVFTVAGILDGIFHTSVCLKSALACVYTQTADSRRFGYTVVQCIRAMHRH